MAQGLVCFDNPFSLKEMALQVCWDSAQKFLVLRNVMNSATSASCLAEIRAAVLIHVDSEVFPVQPQK